MPVVSSRHAVPDCLRSRPHPPGNREVEWQTVCALVETGLGVSLAPASIRRIRLKGVAFRRIDPADARTRVAVAWRKDDPNPLIARLLATVDHLTDRP